MIKRDGFLIGEQAGHPTFDNELARETYSQMMVITSLTGNTDRHYRNWMVDKNGEILAIDNGFTCIRAVQQGLDDFSRDEPDLVDRAEYAFKRAKENTVEGYMTIKGASIKKEHVDKAVKFVNSPKCEEVVRNNFTSTAFRDKAKKHWSAYRGLTDDQITEKATKAAMNQLKAGVSVIKTLSGKVL